MSISLCPVCRRPAHADAAPFCSLRCRDADLLAWLGGGYALPGPAADPETLDKLGRDD